MIKFLFILLSYVAVGVMFLWGVRNFGGKNYEIALNVSEEPVANWPPEKRIRFVKICRVVCLIAGLFLLSGTIPMIQDLPDFYNEKKYEYIEGVPDYITHSAFGSWWFAQRVSIKGKDAHFYFCGHLPKDAYYKIYCLKHSHYAVKAEIIPQPNNSSAF